MNDDDDASNDDDDDDEDVCASLSPFVISPSMLSDMIMRR